jgi:hypothetical protein
MAATSAGRPGGRNGSMSSAAMSRTAIENTTRMPTSA